MHPASQYFAQHLHSHPVDSLVDELRRVGYDDLTISQAWLEVSNAQTAAVAADGGSSRPWTPQGAMPLQSAVQQHVVQPGAPRRQLSSTLIVAGLVLVVAVVGGLFFVRQHDTNSQDALSTRISEKTGISKTEASQALDSLGGATVQGDLPSGWSKLRDGLWANTRTGSSVSVIVTPLPSSLEDVTLDEVASQSIAAAKRVNPTIDLGTDGSDGHALGQESRRFAGEVSGMQVTQDYVRVGSDLAVVTVGGKDQDAFDEAQGLAKRLRPTA
ncbi:MAG: hypothetical protein JWM98_2562 [Thermoleophilia bacterium]|nr:hypothetical protein [Thermoleophilia bacterium]